MKNSFFLSIKRKPLLNIVLIIFLQVDCLLGQKFLLGGNDISLYDSENNTTKTIIKYIDWSPNSFVISDTYVYWIDYNTKGVHKKNLVSGKIDTLLENLSSPRALEIDFKNRTLFYADNEDSIIYKANIDGTDRTNIINTSGFIFDIAVDSINKFIYWADREAGKLFRANYDGGEITTVLDNILAITNIQLDLEHNYIYWHQNQLGEFWRSGINGSNKQLLFKKECANCVYNFSIDFDNGIIYWNEPFDKKIVKANIDGSNEKVIFSDLVSPTDVKYDSYTKTVCFSDTWYFNISRVDTNGFHRRILLDEGTNWVEKIVFNKADEKIYWSDFSGLFRCDLNGFKEYIDIDSFGSAFTLNQEKQMLIWTKRDRSSVYKGDTILYALCNNLNDIKTLTSITYPFHSPILDLYYDDVNDDLYSLSFNFGIDNIFMSGISNDKMFDESYNHGSKMIFIKELSQVFIANYGLNLQQFDLLNSSGYPEIINEGYIKDLQFDITTNKLYLIKDEKIISCDFDGKNESVLKTGLHPNTACFYKFNDAEQLNPRISANLQWMENLEGNYAHLNVDDTTITVYLVCSMDDLLTEHPFSTKLELDAAIDRGYGKKLLSVSGGLVQVPVMDLKWGNYYFYIVDSENKIVERSKYPVIVTTQMGNNGQISGFNFINDWTIHSTANEGDKKYNYYWKIDDFSRSASQKSVLLNSENGTFEDWIISPQTYFYSTGKLNFYIYSESLNNNDTISVFLMKSGDIYEPDNVLLIQNSELNYKTWQKFEINLSTLSGFNAGEIIRFGFKVGSNSSKIFLSEVVYADETTSLDLLNTSYSDLFPNPFNDRVFVPPFKRIKIYDSSGKCILNKNSNEIPDSFIETSNIKRGVYIFEIIDQFGNIMTKKMIK
jgi:hypothetical protein